MTRCASWNHRFVRSLCALVLLTAAANSASATLLSVSPSGTNPETGDPVSAMVHFGVSSMDLIVTITNTSAPTDTNGNVLTGILFDSSITDFSLTKTEVLTGKVWGSKTDDTTTTPPTDWTGGWTDAPGITPPPAGTIGAAATGFGGVFSAAGLTKGTGGADYGAVSNGTYPQGGGGPGSPNQYPLADNEIVLTFSSNQSLDNLSISNVRALFGTSGEGIIAPEPASLLLMIAGALGALPLARRRRAG